MLPITIEPAGAVRVEHDGTLLAQSDRAVILHERGAPDRIYLPKQDVVAPVEGPTGDSTHCPFKGEADYFTIGGLENVAWSYEQPHDRVAAIAGMVAFYNDRVEIR